MDRLEAACRLASESASGQGGPMTVGLRRFVFGLLAGWRLLLEAATPAPVILFVVGEQE